MAASALGVPSTLRFAMPAEPARSFRISAPSAALFTPSSTGHSATFFAELRKGFLLVPFRYRGYACCRVCCLEANARVALSSSPSSETSPSQTSSPPSTEMKMEQKPAIIDLEFLGPERGKDGLPMDKVSVASGEKLLRTVMIEQKLEVYDLYGKIMNCGGGGSCGTCIVEVLEGSELLNERTDAETRYLKKKPHTWRLSCQTIVGDKTNSGKVVVQQLPQKKKKS